MMMAVQQCTLLNTKPHYKCDCGSKSKVKDDLLLFFSVSAIIEHTNKVVYLEDDDVAVVVEGKLSVHRVKRKVGEDHVRVIQTLQVELQQIMKGPRSH